MHENRRRGTAVCCLASLYFFVKTEMNLCCCLPLPCSALLFDIAQPACARAARVLVPAPPAPASTLMLDAHRRGSARRGPGRPRAPVAVPVARSASGHRMSGLQSSKAFGKLRGLGFGSVLSRYTDERRVYIYRRYHNPQHKSAPRAAATRARTAHNGHMRRSQD